MGRFTVNKKYDIEGNIMSLLYGDNFKNQTDLTGKNNAFTSLFANSSTLQSANNLSLPATSLSSSCYEFMFQNCTSLTSVYIIPAVSMGGRSCCYMFKGCTSLVNAPILTAMNLHHACYENMFDGCTALTVAPSLPATNLTSMCYYNMFLDCTSLLKTPSLRAKNLVDRCYVNMFRGCRNLSYARMLATDIYANGDYCLSGWLDLAANEGTVVKDICLKEDGYPIKPTAWSFKYKCKTPSVINLTDNTINFQYEIGTQINMYTPQSSNTVLNDTIYMRSLKPENNIVVRVVKNNGGERGSDNGEALYNGVVWSNTRTFEENFNIQDVSYDDIAIAIIDVSSVPEGDYYYSTIEVDDASLIEESLEGQI
jgi:hypothetical protein